MSEIITTISNIGGDCASIGQLVASIRSDTAYEIIKVPEYMIIGGGIGTYAGIDRARAVLYKVDGGCHFNYEISDAFDSDDDLSIPDPLALRALDELGIQP